MTDDIFEIDAYEGFSALVPSGFFPDEASLAIPLLLGLFGFGGGALVGVTFLKRLLIMVRFRGRFCTCLFYGVF